MAAKRLPRLNGFRLLSVLIGVLLLVSISFYSANTDIATAEDALSTRVDYIKEQCADYSSLNLASEAKSLLRLTESAEQIRRATINDIGGILELISPLEQQGILVRRSREQLEMEIDKFTIIQRDNTTIACAALYPFPEEKIGEMACVAVHPDYRSSSRGEMLLERVAAQARQMGLSKLFVLTTRSIHWFQERGFTPVDIDLLPESKKQMYNYQRRSKVLMADLA